MQLYPHLSPSSNAVLPTGFLGSWDQTFLTGAFGHSLIGLEMDDTSGVSQVERHALHNKTGPATFYRSGVQFLGPPLEAGDIRATTYHLGFAANARVGANAGGQQWGGQAALLLVDGATGQLKAAIFDVSDVGSQDRNFGQAAGEYACVGDVDGAMVTAADGDYLCLELGHQFTLPNQGQYVNVAGYVFFDGSSPIGLDGTSQTDAASVLSF